MDMVLRIAFNTDCANTLSLIPFNSRSASSARIVKDHCTKLTASFNSLLAISTLPHFFNSMASCCANIKYCSNSAASFAIIDACLSEEDTEHELCNEKGTGSISVCCNDCDIN